MTTDQTMAEIMAAIAALQGGDRNGGRRALEAVWTRIAFAPDAFHECILSHHMADTQDDPTDELAWDQRALNAALRCSDADVQRHHPTQSLAVLMPSLQLSLAQDYFKLRDFVRSKVHLEAARGCIDVLADDAYGELLRGALKRLAKGLERAGG